MLIYTFFGTLARPRFAIYSRQWCCQLLCACVLGSNSGARSSLYCGSWRILLVQGEQKEFFCKTNKTTNGQAKKDDEQKYNKKYKVDIVNVG